MYCVYQVPTKWLDPYLLPIQTTGKQPASQGPNSQKLRIYLSKTWAYFYMENYTQVILKFIISFWELGPRCLDTT